MALAVQTHLYHRLCQRELPPRHEGRLQLAIQITLLCARYPSQFPIMRLPKPLHDDHDRLRNSRFFFMIEGEVLYQSARIQTLVIPKPKTPKAGPLSSDCN